MTTPDTREVIDLTSQLDQIELHVAEWDATEQPERPSRRETPEQTAPGRQDAAHDPGGIGIRPLWRWL